MTPTSCAPQTPWAGSRSVLARAPGTARLRLRSPLQLGDYLDALTEMLRATNPPVSLFVCSSNHCLSGEVIQDRRRVHLTRAGRTSNASGQGRDWPIDSMAFIRWPPLCCRRSSSGGKWCSLAALAKRAMELKLKDLRKEIARKGVLSGTWYRPGIEELFAATRGRRDAPSISIAAPTRPCCTRPVSPSRQRPAIATGR